MTLAIAAARRSVAMLLIAVIAVVMWPEGKRTKQ